MEGGSKNQKIENCKKPRKKVKRQAPVPQNQNQNQNQDSNQPHSESDDSSSSSGWSSEVIQPAIKTMTYRTRRGTRMKELIKGKHHKDQFWDKYQTFFGGDLNKPDDEPDEEDYEASSSGRDEFDSDFDLTDSYAGKRGRKKGSKVKRRRKVAAKEEKIQAGSVPKGRRGRKRKVPEPVKQALQQNPLQRQQPVEDETAKKQIIKRLIEKQKFEQAVHDINGVNEYFSLHSPIRRHQFEVVFKQESLQGQQNGANNKELKPQQKQEFINFQHQEKEGRNIIKDK